MQHPTFVTAVFTQKNVRLYLPTEQELAPSAMQQQDTEKENGHTQHKVSWSAVRESGKFELS